jgi:hypothetical protein
MWVPSNLRRISTVNGYLTDLLSHWVIVAPYVRYLERQIEMEKALWAGLDQDARDRSAAFVESLEREIERELPVVGGKPWVPEEIGMDLALKGLAKALEGWAEAKQNAEIGKATATHPPRK